ncbi:MAG: hypothetical protein ACR2LG_08895 [Actinomycetota bacterium]
MSPGWGIIATSGGIPTFDLRSEERSEILAGLITNLDSGVFAEGVEHGLEAFLLGTRPDGYNGELAATALVSVADSSSPGSPPAQAVTNRANRASSAIRPSGVWTSKPP